MNACDSRWTGIYCILDERLSRQHLKDRLSFSSNFHAQNRPWSLMSICLLKILSKNVEGVLGWNCILASDSTCLSGWDESERRVSHRYGWQVRGLLSIGKHIRHWWQEPNDGSKCSLKGMADIPGRLMRASTRQLRQMRIGRPHLWGDQLGGDSLWEVSFHSYPCAVTNYTTHLLGVYLV